MRCFPSLTPLACMTVVALIFGVGCASDETAQSGAVGGAAPLADLPAADGGNAPVTARRRGTPVKVTWEALAHERYLFENTRYSRGLNTGIRPDHQIVLVNESHPEADQIRQGRVRSADSVGSGVISDQQMKDFLLGLEKIGYFKAATATSAQARFFEDDRARGRVTVERPNGSVTLLSMRGQGLNASTKHVPGIYSQTKQAIAYLKNQTRTLTVETIGRDSVPYR